MSRLCIAFAAVGILLVGPVSAEAGVVVTVNKSTQRLTVEVDGVERHKWPVSTGRWGYRTPNGSYRPLRLARKWYSRKYDNSPMPHSIFFHGGYAIHGSYEIRNLGRPASHGCIRLLPKNAAVLFKIVKANRSDTKIVITGERPSRRAVARRAREETGASRQRERAAERRTRQRAPSRRARARQPTFNDVFAPPSYAARRRGSHPTWDDMLNRNNPGQRALRRWWYSR